MFFNGRLLFAQSLSGHTSSVEAVEFDTAEVLVLAGSSNGSIKLWDLEEAKGVVSAYIKPPEEGYYIYCFSFFLYIVVHCNQLFEHGNCIIWYVCVFITKFIYFGKHGNTRSEWVSLYCRVPVYES